MSYEFKKLGEVDSVSTLPVTANALVEIDGAVRRVPAGVLASAPLVILPETELTMLSDMEGRGGQYMLSTPFATNPTAGGTYKLMWGGVEYTSKAVDMPALIEGMPPCIVLGNVAITGEVEGVENPDPSAPYAMMIYKDGVMDGDLTAYAVMVSVGITPEPPTISIVQVGAASGGEGAGATALIVNLDIATMTIDKPFTAAYSALSAGKPVQFQARGEAFTHILYPCTYSESYINLFQITHDNYMTPTGLVINSDGTISLRTGD